MPQSTSITSEQTQDVLDIASHNVGMSATPLASFALNAKPESLSQYNTRCINICYAARLAALLAAATQLDGVRWRAIRLHIMLLALAHGKSAWPVGLHQSYNMSSPLSASTSACQRLCAQLLDQAHDMSVWLPVVAKWTLQTHLVTASTDIQQAIPPTVKALCEVYYKVLRTSGGAVVGDGLIHWLEMAFGTMEEKQAQQCRGALQELSNLLDIPIKAYCGIDGHTRGAFVKLTSRSPKDSLLLTPRNGRLSVMTGVEAVELLCGSTRVADDVEAASSIGRAVAFAVRPWCNIPRWSEMRGFVCHRRLTALSQYFTTQAFPQLVDPVERMALVAQYQTLADAIISALPYEHVVLDFALSGDDSKDADNMKGGVSTLTPILLEVNPFSLATGAGLFSWRVDAAVLYGEAEFEVRVVQESGV
jgi:hypothetical protein